MQIPNPETIPEKMISSRGLLRYLRERITVCSNGIARAKKVNNIVSRESWQDQYAVLTRVYFDIIHNNYK